MSKMNETELRRRLGLLSEIEPSPQRAGQALDRVRQSLAQATVLSDDLPARLWRVLTRSRMAGLAAAASILVVFLTSVLIGPVDGTTAAYARVAEAVRNVPWMHMRYSGYNLDDQGNRTTAEGKLDTEIWCSFSAQVMIYRYAGGGIEYYDYARREVQRYNPDARRIVVSAWPATRRPFGTVSPWDWLEESIEQITSEGGNVTCKRGRYNGQEVEVFDVVGATRRGVATVHRRIFVNRMTSLPFAEERTFVNASSGKPQRIETGTFDYPGQGPEDIHGLGLSPDVPTINSLPMPPWEDTRLTYGSYQRRAPAEKYIAIVIRKMAITGDPLTDVEVCYCDGGRFRVERHSLIGLSGSVREQSEAQASEIGDTVESILKWSRDYKAYGSIFISLLSGDRCYYLRRDDEGVWGTTVQAMPNRVRTADSSWSLCPVAELGWPDIREPADVLPSDYATRNHLICVDSEGGTFYLNPDRDYICHRRITTGGDFEDVEEYGRTDDGRWYPKKVKGHGFSSVVYLEINPVFPEGVFDPNSLPEEDREQASTP